MNKWLNFILLAFLPVFAYAADGSLSFAPPATDYSVIFLGNLFGVVDGVLRGSGSQIMGVMFGVFNSAVLALGGIIIMYTLMVSTMNTAHEGQMLGQKWSSIWIPVRSTLGLALLIPKASGYCLMQIFVMWVVVQGVGAADKIWEAALSYLNRGGVIIKAQADPTKALTAAKNAGVPGGALAILSGQICMMGLQKQLENQRQEYLQLKNRKSGPCSGDKIKPKMKAFCDTPVPDFVASVNAVAVQNKLSQGTVTSFVTNKVEKKVPKDFEVTMPNLDSGPYASLNGVCGKIKWNSIEGISKLANPGTGGGTTAVGGITGINASELETAQLSRAIAIQQMYIDLSLIATVMINNDPNFGSAQTANAKNFAPFANQQFGVPYTNAGASCKNYSEGCTVWGVTKTAEVSSATVLFNGTEFQGAISNYNAIMFPTLNLLKQSKDSANANASRKFITEANSRGWIMAGSYFFDLVRLNGNATDDKDLVDSNTGLDGSAFDAAMMTASFEKSGCKDDVAPLCTWFEGNSGKLTAIISLLDGSVKGGNGVDKPDLKDNPNREQISGQNSSTVYGFINNSMMMQLPGQPGLAELKFANLIKFSVDTTPYRLKEQDFDCGRVRIVVFSFCLGEMFGELFYNTIFLFIYNFFMAAFQQIINQVVMAFLMIPLQGMAEVFKVGLETVSKPGVNPVIALANMGTMYINFSGNLWIMILTMSITSSLIPVFGVFIFALISLALPLLIAWVGIMLSVGFTTAYYVPMLPYMIFTFGSIAWLISVIEAMVAAPIVALGVTHPEGHDAFGKGEAAIMILMNVFLRPAMMIIGYISAIALCYVGVWILNAGFDHAIGFVQGGAVHDTSTGDGNTAKYGGQLETQNLSDGYQDWQQNANTLDRRQNSGSVGSGSGDYTEWAGIYAYFFSILIYTTMYLTIVQKAFTLITYLPDKVLRWIGGSPESLGSDAAGWTGETEKQIGEGAKETKNAQGQIDKQLGGYAQKGVAAVKGGGDQASGGQGSAQAQGDSGGDDDGKGGGGGGKGGGGGGKGGGGGAPGGGGGPQGGPPAGGNLPPEAAAAV